MPGVTCMRFWDATTQPWHPTACLKQRPLIFFSGIRLWRNSLSSHLEIHRRWNSLSSHLEIHRKLVTRTSWQAIVAFVFVSPQLGPTSSTSGIVVSTSRQLMPWDPHTQGQPLFSELPLVQKGCRFDCHPACSHLHQTYPVVAVASTEMAGKAGNSMDLMVPASEVLVLLAGPPGTLQWTRKEMDSWGRLHGSVEVEDASEPDPSYSWACHQKAFGILGWGSG
jgi:hypothetical protein